MEPRDADNLTSAVPPENVGLPCPQTNLSESLRSPSRTALGCLASENV